jgi:hypothetical protein
MKLGTEESTEREIEGVKEARDTGVNLVQSLNRASGGERPYCIVLVTSAQKRKIGNEEKKERCAR